MKNYLTKSDVENYLKSNRILIAKIADLLDYQGTEADEYYAKKAKEYLRNGKYGKLPIGETENFLARSDGFVYGWVETKGRSGSDSDSKKNNEINIDRLYGFEYKRDYEKIDNCLVIFLTIQTRFIVGYYKDATIYRERQENKKYSFKIKGIGSVEKREITNIFFNLKTKADNAILLKNRFNVDVKNGVHCGQSNLKYVDEKNREYIKNNILDKLIDRE